MPTDRILTESDGPFVRMGSAPVDPSSASMVVAFLSTLWKIAESEVARTILTNSGLEQFSNSTVATIRSPLQVRATTVNHLRLSVSANW